ncbi:MAG TPA: heme-binding beta-barrel domain-containing protein [Noviherbaspirillum sp.]|jgi:hypothetical protein|uniref:FABP family protein n=1 Tax=Noviherbaspirillum sp. TaxID=1926288 RepID=UPI002F94A17E
MTEFSKDIYTEPRFDPDTLANLGPLRGMAGVWEGTRGLDIKPKADGARKQAFVERFELQPIDPQTNGPQLFYGLRYHQHARKPGEAKTYHDQIGYFLWEPATGSIIQTVAIPRGQVAMAVGQAAADAASFELVATKGHASFGICSNPFIAHAFDTLEYRIKVTINDDGTWSYDEDVVMMIRGQQEPFHHKDRNTLHRVGEPLPNPAVRG